MPRSVPLLLATLLLTSAALSAQGPTPPDLLKSLPGTFNTLAVVNVESILKSPRAVKEGWDKIDKTAYLAGAIPIHPAVERIVATTEFTPGQRRDSSAQAVVPVKKPIDLARVAAGLHGQLVEVGGEQAVATSAGSYLVKLEPQLLGLMRTTHRQDLSRWVQAKKENTLPAPPRYLTNTAANFATRSHVVVALDAGDLFDAAAITTAVGLSPSLDQDKKAAGQVKQFLGALRGVRLIGTFTEAGTEFRVTLDSNHQPTCPPELMKQFVAEFLERNGLMPTDMAAAVAKNGETDFSLTLKITDDELGYLMALVLPPISADIAASDALPVTPAGVTREASQKHVVAVNGILDGLKKRNDTATDYFQTALWHETAARQIAAMSVIAVEPAAVEYAHGTTVLLREIANSLRGVPVQAAVLEQNAYLYQERQPLFVWTPFYGVQYNPWFGAGGAVQTNLPEIRQRQADAIRADALNRANLWGKIDGQRSVVLRAVAAPK